MKPRKKRGFSIEIDKVKYSVYFKEYMNYITICYIENLDTGESWFGKAKCNTGEGDVFNQDEGRSISFERAVDKMKKSFNRYMIDRIKRIEKWNMNIDNNLNTKFKKLVSKGLV